MIKKWFSKFNLRKKAKFLSAFVLGALILGISAVSFQPADKALGETINTPRFNFLTGDYEMLRAAKVTASTWADPINVSVGDRVAFLFYYHNGIVDSTAHHVKLRVDLPLETSASLQANNFLWSQETAAISDTVVDGNIVGQTGATINLPSPGRLQYVPGSTKWFPNRATTPTNVPDGIVSSSGLDIGDIQGCWQYAGFVSFLADIKAPASLVLDKTVAHPGDAEWRKEITANPGDSAAYHLGIRNDGQTTAAQVSVKDLLPIHMIYETGTTYIYTKDHPEGIKQADTLFSTGISLPNMIPGNDGIIYVTYRVKVNTDFPSGAFVLNNVAKVFMQGLEQDQDQAKVFVTANRGLVIDKEVSNGVSWVENSTAQLGDEIMYRVIVKNTGNMAINNVMIKDAFPVFVRYKAGSTTVDGTTVGDEIAASGGLNIGSLNPGQQKTIIFSGFVYGCPPIGSYTLTNTAYTWADTVAQISDFATSTLNLNSVIQPGINN